MARKLLWDFGIHTDHLITARRPDPIIVNSSEKPSADADVKSSNDFAVRVDHRIRLKECEKKDEYLDLSRELKKTMEHAGDNYTNCDRCV